MTIKNYFTAVWTNRRHFKMQIFGVMVFITVFIFVVNFISISISYNKKVDNFLATTVQHTSSFQMSLSGVKGSVEQIYIDSTKTKCFILLKFKDMSLMTLTAGKYQMFLTNCDGSGREKGTPKEQITGEIYMLGTGGLVGLYFRSDIPFENQMKSLVLRSYTNLSKNTTPYYKRTASDGQYDQCHIFFNPGGTKSTNIGFLEYHQDGTSFDITQIYRQVYSVVKEEEIRSQIDGIYSAMQGDMSQILEYRKRFSDIYNIQLPDFSQYMKGDNFEDIEIYDSNGNVTGTYKKFVPATIVPGGVDFDWYNGSILTSYYGLVSDRKNKSIREYLSGLSNDADRRSLGKVIPEAWYYTDGTEIDTGDSVKRTSAETSAYNAIQDYEALVKDYMEKKKEYQTKVLVSLLSLERDSDFSEYICTVRNDADTLIVY